VRHLSIRVAVPLSAVKASFLSLPACGGLEAGPADQSDRALDCGRLDRSGHRLVAGEMEKSLGQTIVIINQPGASGSIGTRSALEATKDVTPGRPARRRISAPSTLLDKFLVNYALMPGLFGRQLCARSSHSAQFGF
jgi:hypothetical protein